MDDPLFNAFTRIVHFEDSRAYFGGSILFGEHSIEFQIDRRSLMSDSPSHFLHPPHFSLDMGADRKQHFVLALDVVLEDSIHGRPGFRIIRGYLR